MAATTKETDSGEKKGAKQFTVRLVGIAPMLQNRMTEATLDSLIRPGATKKPPKTDISFKDMAAEKLHLGPNDEFGVPEAYVFACLAEAGRRVVYDGKTRISTKETTLLPSFLTIVAPVYNADGGFFPFVNQEEKWVVDKRRGVNRTTKGATGILRPKFLKWALDIVIELDMDVIAIEKVRELFRAAGSSVGFGDFRPTSKGPFGRFKVESFTELEQSVDLQQAA